MLLRRPERLSKNVDKKRGARDKKLLFRLVSSGNLQTAVRDDKAGNDNDKAHECKREAGGCSCPREDPCREVEGDADNADDCHRRRLHR